MASFSGGPNPGSHDQTIETDTEPTIMQTVVGLDAWFDFMRRPGGYGGPVVHWWRDCLDYTGPGLDWRYEGIIAGYLNLWVATGEDRWVDKAKRAADDLVAGQLPSGNYRNSCFELNPNTGGTPHEAACDLALLRLAGALRENDDSAWEQYYQTAEGNLTGYFIGRLWDTETQSFDDNLSGPSFVPNKAATLAEALLALASLTSKAEWAERYALPTLHKVLEHQVEGGELDGAIYQNSFGGRRVAKFFPYYAARCLPGLIEGYSWSRDERLAQAARRAAGFILRWRCEDGGFPQVVYPGGQANRYPQWVSGVGDVLRTLKATRALGLEFDEGPTLAWLLRGRQADGTIRTAVGFGKATLGGNREDRRDTICVCGWADKAFRYLTECLRPTEADHPPQWLDGAGANPRPGARDSGTADSQEY